MRIARVLLGSIERRPLQHLQSVRYLSAGNGFNGQEPNSNSAEPVDEFEQRIFGSLGDSPRDQAFYQKFDKRHGSNESFNTLSDGILGKLKKAATSFEFDMNEIDRDDYGFRPDVRFRPGSTYDTKDLDLRRPGVHKPLQERRFDVTTEEVLKQADFRNVRFLANFITEAGIIIKRSSTGISAKAQRKVAREIKTARAFGLMPFTTMGKKSFVFGRSMETRDDDYEYETFEADQRDPFEG